MPYRVHYKDFLVECDSVNEVLALLVHESVPSTKPRQTKPQTESRQRIEKPHLTESSIQVLKALKAAYPQTLTSEELAMRIGKSAKSLPPIINVIRTWAKNSGIEFESVIRRKQDFLKGKPMSMYRLTDEGLKRVEDVISEGSVIQTPHLTHEQIR